jgi:hypothetical protein
MKKSRGAVYISMTAFLLAVFAESFAERDVSSMVLILITTVWLLVLALGDETR